MTDQLKLGVLGIDHRHIFGMLGNMQAEGCTCNQWWTKDDTEVEAGFIKRFPNIERVSNFESILEDPDVKMVLISSIPIDRASLAIRAMEAGKDVMVDKPGCISLAQLQQIRECVERTGRIWSVNFSERFEVPAVTLADKLILDGKIGRVIQTLGIGPHRQKVGFHIGQVGFLTATYQVESYVISVHIKLINFCILLDLQMLKFHMR